MNQQSQNLYSQQPQMDSKFQYTDEELILRFQEGDEQAYIELAQYKPAHLLLENEVSTPRQYTEICYPSEVAENINSVIADSSSI